MIPSFQKHKTSVILLPSAIILPVGRVQKIFQSDGRYPYQMPEPSQRTPLLQRSSSSNLRSLQMVKLLTLSLKLRGKLRLGAEDGNTPVKNILLSIHRHFSLHYKTLQHLFYSTVYTAALYFRRFRELKIKAVEIVYKNVNNFAIDISNQSIWLCFLGSS